MITIVFISLHARQQGTHGAGWEGSEATWLWMWIAEDGGPSGMILGESHLCLPAFDAAFKKVTLGRCRGPGDAARRFFDSSLFSPSPPHHAFRRNKSQYRSKPLQVCF